MPAQIHQWPFTPPAAPSPPISNPLPPQTFKSFLGRGIVAPFRRDRKTDFASASGEALVRSRVAEILGVQCSDAGGTLQGELPWRHAFGSMLYRLKHKKGIVLQELARVYVIDALRRWEPAVQVSNASVVSFDRDTRTLTIRLRYDVIKVNSPSNAVVLQGIDQTIDVPLAA